MLRRAFPLAVLLMAASAAAETDGQARHSLGAAVGLRASTVREDLLVPLSFSGTGLRVGARYAGLAGPGLLTARLDLGIRALWTRFGQIGAGLDTEVDASWLAHVHESGSWRFSLGPALAHNGSVHYLPEWDDAHGYWLGAQWLGLSGRILYGLGPGWRIEATPTVALLGFRSRPPAYRFNKQDALTHVGWWFEAPTRDAEFMTLAGTQLLRLDLALRAAPVGASDAAGGWSFGIDSRLQRVDAPNTLIALEAVFYAANAWEWP